MTMVTTTDDVHHVISNICDSVHSNSSQFLSITTTVHYTTSQNIQLKLLLLRTSKATTHHWSH